MDVQPAASEPVLSAPRCCVAHAWLSTERYAVIEREAQRRRLHPDQLVARILEHVADDLIFAAILDV